MRRKISRCKKGIGIDDALPLIVFILAAAFIIFAFRINYNVKLDKTAKSIQEPKDAIYGHELLINYLSQTGAEGKSKAQTISELYLDKKYDQIKLDIQSYFKAKLEPIPRWDIDILDEYGDVLVSIRGGNAPNADKIFVNSAIIPVNSNEPSYISIRLFMSRDVDYNYILTPG